MANEFKCKYCEKETAHELIGKAEDSTVETYVETIKDEDGDLLYESEEKEREVKWDRFLNFKCLECGNEEEIEQ